MPFLDDLAAETRERVLGAGRRRRFAAGQAVFVHDDGDDHVLLLVAGWVKIVMPTASGRETVLAVRGPGELIGELAALAGTARSASVTALSDVEAVAIDGGGFRRLVSEDPEIALVVHRGLAARLQESIARQVEQIAHDSAGRIASRLVELAVTQGAPGADGTVRVELLLTQEELGSWTGSSRESVARALATLRRAGWIETNGRSVVVRDLPALRRRAGL